MQTATQHNIKAQPAWALMLFSLPFAAIGLGFLLFSIIPSLYEWQTISRWQPVPAQVLEAKLEYSQSDGSTSYQATATYTYTFNNQSYTHSRVGINSGFDNIGSWQQDKSRALKKHQKNKDLIIVYVNPKNPEQSIIYPELRIGLLLFKLVFAIVFGGVGFGLLFYSLKKNHTIAPHMLASNTPWQADKNWQNPIKSNAKSGLWFTWIFTIFWNLISLPITIMAFSQKLPEDNKLVWFVLFFPIVGLFLLRWAIKATTAWRHFGPTLLWLEPYPGAIGGHIGGTVKCGKKLTAATANITLECVYHYMSGSGKNRKSKQSIVWQAHGTSQVEVFKRTTGPESEIKFCFDVPAKLPASTLNASTYHSWRVTLDIDDNKAQLHRQFTIPAFPSTQKSTLNITETASNHLTRNQQEQELENLLNIQQIPGGIFLQHKMGRNLQLNASFFVVGAILCGAGLWMGITKEASFFMAAIFTLMGGAIGLFFLYKMINSYNVKIGTQGIYTERFILGLKVKQHDYPPNAIKNLKKVNTASSSSGNTHTEHFVIKANLHNGHTVNIAESLNGNTLADYALESISLLSGYPIEQKA